MRHLPPALGRMGRPHRGSRHRHHVRPEVAFSVGLTVMFLTNRSPFDKIFRDLVRGIDTAAVFFVYYSPIWTLFWP